MEDYIYGKNTVIELINAGTRIEEVYIAEHLKKDKDLFSLLKKAGVPFHYVDKEYLNKMIKGNHKGFVAKIKPYQYASVDEVIALAKKRHEAPFLIILDGLEDPHNLGAILRTADACGVHGVIIPKNRSVSLNATVAKLSTGAIEYVKVSRVTNISQTIKELKSNGLWIIGTDANTNMDYREMDATLPLAIVVGNEGKGISRLVREHCDFLVKIPMRGHVTSLNASVATSLLMYEVYNKRCPLS